MKKIIKPKSNVKINKAKSFKKLFRLGVLLTIILVAVYVSLRQGSISPLIAKPTINKIIEIDTNVTKMDDVKTKAANTLNTAADKAERAKTQQAKEATTVELLIAGETYSKVTQKNPMTNYDEARKAAIEGLKTDKDLDAEGNLTEQAKSYYLIGNTAGAGITSKSPGASCKGASSNIGSGQWAQTGGGLKNENNEPIENSHACVQCLDGEWKMDRLVQCGDGAASAYITRPDEVIDCKATPDKSCAKASCWVSGTWYADSAKVDNKGYCHNGDWVDNYIRAKEKECTARGDGSIYNENLKSCVIQVTCVSPLVIDKANNVCVETQGNVVGSELEKECSDAGKDINLEGTACVTRIACGLGFASNGHGGCKKNSGASIDTYEQQCDSKAGIYDRTTGICNLATTSVEQLTKCNEVRIKNNKKGATSWITCTMYGEITYRFCGTGFNETGLSLCDSSTGNFGNNPPIPDGTASTPKGTTKNGYVCWSNDDNCESGYCAPGLFLSTCKEKRPNSVITDISTANTTGPERDSLIEAYEALEKNGVDVQTISVDDCSTSTSCFDYKDFIDLTDLRTKINANPKIINAQNQYEEIIKVDKKAFSGFGYNDFYTQTSCESKNLDCIKVKSGLFYTYLTVDQLEEKAAELKLDIPNVSIPASTFEVQ